MALVGDRGMITSACLRDDLRPAGLDWITCLRGRRSVPGGAYRGQSSAEDQMIKVMRR